MRRQVDGSIAVVASPACFSPDALSAALLLWPRVTHLTLLAVSDATDLAPLATAALARLTSLTVRQAPRAAAGVARPWDMPATALSSRVAATLRVIDLGGCINLRSIELVRSCAQLRCLWMPGCLLGPDSTAGVQYTAAGALYNLAYKHAQIQGVITAAGAIPALVRLLGPDSTADVKETAAHALGSLAGGHAGNQAAITAAGAIPALVRLLGPESTAGTQTAAARTLRILACDHAHNKATISAAGSIPALMQLMGPDMQTLQDNSLTAEAAAATEKAHAVLFSPDLWLQQLWRWLDRDSKAALRGASVAMRRQVDGSIEVVASPACDPADLAPLATAALARLASLTVREAPRDDDADEARPWDMLVTALSSSVAATLQVIDLSGCINLHSIELVRSCAKLRCLWMPGCVSVSDLSPLGACSETLEELWMAGDDEVRSLAPLAACTKLRKLDLSGCLPEIYAQVEGLRATCTQLAVPSSVELEGLVHELQHSFPPDIQEGAVRAVVRITLEGHLEAQDAIAAAGAIPALVQLLGPDSTAGVQASATLALCLLATDHAQNQAAIGSAAGAIPALVKLLAPNMPAEVRRHALLALCNLAANHAQNQAVMAAAGAIPILVQLLGPESLSDVQAIAARTLGSLAFNHAQNLAAAGAVPALVQLLGPGSSADVQLGPGSSAGVQENAAGALMNLALDAGLKVTIAAAGAIPPLVQLLGSGSPPGVQEAATGVLMTLMTQNTVNQVAMAAAGAIPSLVRLLGAGSPAGVQEWTLVALSCLAENADNQVTIAAAGAIPPLVQLLGSGPPADMQDNTAAALLNLAANSARTLMNLAANAGNKVTIAAAGAIPPLMQLLGPGSQDQTKTFASWALKSLAESNVDNQVAIAAAADSADLLQEMRRLGIDGGPSDMPA
ncbi:hypothetical protein FOA52_002301 [Chlamydomonas sp. UWO 241]|nr:hypothetical protein FOA52_002301 [Chlamydomonas sp. UWO 241]